MVDLLHELAVVVQQRGVHAGAGAAGVPALLGFVGVGLQLLHLFACDLPFALELAQRAERFVAALFREFHHLVQRLDVAHDL
ncbi:hypothetical protein D9M69_693790 [compost metagenome]